MSDLVGALCVMRALLDGENVGSDVIQKALDILVNAGAERVVAEAKRQYNVLGADDG